MSISTFFSQIIKSLSIKRCVTYVFSQEYGSNPRNLSLPYSLFSVASFDQWNESKFCECRSSHRRCSFKKLFLKTWQNSQETPVPESFFKKLQVCRPATLFKRDSNTGLFPENFEKFSCLCEYHKYS